MRRLFDQIGKNFEKGGRWHKLEPLWEAIDTFAFTPGKVTTGRVAVRDSTDLKRAMITVVIALVPAILFGLFNAGYQSHLAVSRGAALLPDWQSALYTALGFAGNDLSVLACVVHGLLYYLPVLVVTFAVGGFWEVLFAVVRRHEVNEGFFVTAMLFPMVLPATIPLWQVAMGISFGVVIGKEVFGGVGMNVFNPALVGRVFLFFAYPGDISGDAVWVPALTTGIDGVSGATYLAEMKAQGLPFLAQQSWTDAFLGLRAGSFGETSALAILLGAALLVVTRVASWRIMLGTVLGLAFMVTLCNLTGSTTNPAFAVPLHWHLILGGFAFGAVFMATDPVSAPFTPWGRLIYGFAIGALAGLVRIINPAYPEGMMLAILLMNAFSNFIDFFFVRANIQRRAKRYEA
jgi:Na+-transporting NADH:ubiquinone oxidoreductase subunit B